jgi:NAD(P)-dependent dehydrogenase (short-subunit alcohol dehydrogenase family)
MAAQTLAGRVALVTGGARGIGLACATGLSRAGAAVVITDRLDREGKAAAHAIAAGGGKAAFVAADLSRTPEIGRVVEEAGRAFGRLDILVNNAGILSEVPSDALTEEQWDRLMSVNLKAVFFVS